MTPHLIPIYGFATMTIMLLCLFARQNRNSGWKRHRPETLAEALQEFYTDANAAREEPAIVPEWKPLQAEETISFSAQMLKLRSALGANSPVTQDSPVLEPALVRR